MAAGIAIERPACDGTLRASAATGSAASLAA